MSELEPKPPELLQKIEWIRRYGLRHWKLLLIALALVSIAGGFRYCFHPTPPVTTSPSPPAPRPAPVVRITEVPPAGAGPDSRGSIRGTVKNLQDSEPYKIVIYAFTDKWYVQPVADQPFTDIAADGTWSNWTHLGSAYAALIVRLPYTPPAVTEALPAVGGTVLARDTKDARDSG